MFAKLLVIAGPEQGKTFEVVANVPLVIGRSREADGRLSDPRVSPFHCRVEVRKGQLFATDLDSAVGTAVNNVFVLEYTLQFGDTLTVGDSILLVQDPDAPEAVPAHVGGKAARTPAGTRSVAAAPAAPQPAAPAATGSSAAHAPLSPRPGPAPAPAAAKPASKLPERVEQLEGHLVSSYRVEKMIARGRGGVVYRAFDQKGNRPVALKVLHQSSGQDEKAVAGFTLAMKLA